MILIREYKEKDDEAVKKIFRNGMRSHLMACLISNLLWWPCYSIHGVFIISCYFLLNLSTISIAFTCLTSVTVHFWFISREFEKYYSLESKDLKNISKYYDGQKGSFWVAEDIDNKEIVGHAALDASLSDSHHLVELRRCAVLQSYRKKGVAKLLVEYLVNSAKSEYKASKIFLTTSTIQNAAIILYKKCGFCITDYNVDKFMFNVKVIRMEKSI